MRKLFTLTLVALTLIACRFASGLQSTEAPQVTVTGLSVGADVVAPGDYELQLGDQEDTRTVYVHIPPQYDGEQKLPLLLVLHGGGGGGKQVQNQTGMSADADTFGFVVAYPNGSGRFEDAGLTWNAGHCCAYALSQQVDDVGFLSLLIDRLTSHFAIDPQRVYVTGLSNGGMMSYRAGAELADKVAGIAPVAGTIGGQLRESGISIYPDLPSEPVSVIAFHGKADQHVLYDGGVGPEAIDGGRVDLSVDSSVSFWVKANGCGALPETETQADGNIIIETYSGCQNGTEVVLVTIVDGGHAWPGGDRTVIGDRPTKDISANQMMLQFFLEHPKE